MTKLPKLTGTEYFINWRRRIIKITEKIDITLTPADGQIAQVSTVGRVGKMYRMYNA